MFLSSPPARGDKTAWTPELGAPRVGGSGSFVCMSIWLCTIWLCNQRGRAYPSPGCRFKPLHQLMGGALSWDRYVTVAQYQARAYARTLLHAVSDPPTHTAAPQITSELAETLHPLLTLSHCWDIYVDGSWYPIPSSAESQMGEMWDHTGGCSLVFVASDAPLTAGFVLMRLDAQYLSVDRWNLSASLRAPYFSSGYKKEVEFLRLIKVWPRDCPRRHTYRSGQRSGPFLALSTWDILQEGQISIAWHQGHPERREENRSLWSRDDWGCFLANLYAPPPRRPPLFLLLPAHVDHIDAIRQ